MDTKKDCDIFCPAAGTLPCGKPAGQHRRWEPGQTLVMVALLMVVLVGSLALVIDVGNAYTQRRLAQNAADAAALAGVRVLALDGGEAAIDAAVNEYAVQRNPAQSYEMAVLTDSVVVTVTKTFSTFFASVVGAPTMTAVAVAEGAYGFPSSYQGPDLLPIALHKDAVPEPGSLELVEIWNDTVMESDLANGIVANGHRGWLNLNGGESNSNELVPWIENGYGGKIKVDDWINGEPGTKATVLQAAFDYRRDKRVIVPIFDMLCPKGDDTCWVDTGNGSFNYHIIAFGAFTVTEVQSTAHPKYIAGKFDRYVTAEDAGGKYDYGVRVIGLRR